MAIIFQRVRLFGEKKEGTGSTFKLMAVHGQSDQTLSHSIGMPEEDHSLPTVFTHTPTKAYRLTKQCTSNKCTHDW